MHLKKNIKSYISIVIIVILLFSASTSALAQSYGYENFNKIYDYSTIQFLDVAESYWFANNVQYAYELGLMQGTSSTYFNANGKISIAETITLAARLHSIYSTGEELFIQEGEKPWYKVYIDYCLNNNIIKNTYTDYTKSATRAEFVNIIANALPYKALLPINTIENGTIPDVCENATYYSNVYILYRAGILTGMDEFGNFNPNSYIYRSAVAAIATRMANPSLRISFNLNKANFAGFNKFVEEVVCLVNQERIKAGLNELVIDSKLSQAANIRAAEIQNCDQLSHIRPDGTTCKSVLNELSIIYTRFGENLAIGYTSSTAMMKALMNSPGHRENILNPDFKHIGVGVLANTYGKYQGYAWVQLFTD